MPNIKTVKGFSLHGKKMSIAMIADVGELPKKSIGRNKRLRLACARNRINALLGVAAGRYFPLIHLGEYIGLHLRYGYKTESITMPGCTVQKVRIPSLYPTDGRRRQPLLCVLLDDALVTVVHNAKELSATSPASRKRGELRREANMFKKHGLVPEPDWEPQGREAKMFKDQPESIKQEPSPALLEKIWADKGGEPTRPDWYLPAGPLNNRDLLSTLSRQLTDLTTQGIKRHSDTLKQLEFMSNAIFDHHHRVAKISRDIDILSKESELVRVAANEDKSPDADPLHGQFVKVEEPKGKSIIFSWPLVFSIAAMIIAIVALSKVLALG